MARRGKEIEYATFRQVVEKLENEKKFGSRSDLYKAIANSAWGLSLGLTEPTIYARLRAWGEEGTDLAWIKTAPGKRGRAPGSKNGTEKPQQSPVVRTTTPSRPVRPAPQAPAVVGRVDRQVVLTPSGRPWCKPAGFASSPANGFPGGAKVPWPDGYTDQTVLDWVNEISEIAKEKEIGLSKEAIAYWAVNYFWPLEYLAGSVEDTRFEQERIRRLIMGVNLVVTLAPEATPVEVDYEAAGLIDDEGDDWDKPQFTVVEKPQLPSWPEASYETQLLFRHIMKDDKTATLTEAWDAADSMTDAEFAEVVGEVDRGIVTDEIASLMSQVGVEQPLTKFLSEEAK